MDHNSLSLRIRPGEYHSFMGMSGNVEIIEGSTQHFDNDSYRKTQSGLVDIDEFENYSGLLYQTSSKSKMWRR